MTNHVFDFNTHWDLVVPHLKDPLVLRALDAGMVSLCDKNQTKWDPVMGPWVHCKSSYWPEIIMDRYDVDGGDTAMSEWCRRRGCPSYKDSPQWHEIWREINESSVATEHVALLQEYHPKPDTFEWYQCFGGCHWIAAWCCALGQLMFPSKKWVIIKGYYHSTAFGVEDDHSMYMDILWFEDSDPDMIWKACNTPGCEYNTLLEEVEWLESRPYVPACPGCGSEAVEVTYKNEGTYYKGAPYPVQIIITECRKCGEIHIEASNDDPYQRN